MLRQDGETRRRQRRAVLSSYTARGSVKEGRLAWRLHARASRELQSWRFVYSAERRRRRRRRHNERRDRCARVAGRIDRVIDGSGHQVDSTTRRARGGCRRLPAVGARLSCTAPGTSWTRPSEADKMTARRTNDAPAPRSSSSTYTSSRANFLIELSAAATKLASIDPWISGPRGAERHHWSAAKRTARGDRPGLKPPSSPPRPPKRRTLVNVADSMKTFLSNELYCLLYKHISRLLCCHFQLL